MAKRYKDLPDIPNYFMIGVAYKMVSRNSAKTLEGLVEKCFAVRGDWYIYYSSTHTPTRIVGAWYGENVEECFEDWYVYYSSVC